MFGDIDPEARRLLLFAALLILLASVFSNGYHHPDEYFQTLEFAGLKLGRTPPSALPWEYAFKMRSWLQPGLYVLIARGATSLGIRDPFLWAFLFRLFSGVCGWCALVGLALCCSKWFDEKARRRAIRVLCLGWFVPYLAVRTSSESLGGSFFILGLCLLILGSNRAALLLMAGALFGCAFEYRYAMGVAILGVLLWAAVFARIPPRSWVSVTLGLGLVLGLSSLVDRWGYGVWAVPSWNYLSTNLFKGRAASEFGELPIYGLLVLAAETPAAPLILLLLAGSLLAWVRRPFHPLTWASAPLFLIHSLISHKEMRFMFPIAFMAPLLLVLGSMPSGDKWDRLLVPLWNAPKSLVGRGVMVLNLLALAVLSLVPTRPQIQFQSFVRHRFREHFEAYLGAPESPWVLGGHPMYFFRPEVLELHPVETLEAIERPRFLVVTSPFEGPSLKGKDCKPLYRAWPEILERVVGPALQEIWAWDLYRCVEKRRT